MPTLEHITNIIEKLKDEKPFTVDEFGFNFNSSYWSLSNPISQYMKGDLVTMDDARALLEKTLKPVDTVQNCALNVVIANGIATAVYWNSSKFHLRNHYAELLQPIITNVRTYGSTLEKTIELAYLFQMFHEELQVDTADQLWLPFKSTYEEGNSKFIDWLFEPYPEFAKMILLDKELLLFKPDDLGFHKSLNHVIGLYYRLNLNIKAEPIEFNF